MRGLVPALLLLGLAWLAWRRVGQVEEATQGEALPGLSLANVVEEVQTMIQPDAVDASTADANVGAFLMMIRFAEGTAGPDGYRTLFGGGLFDGFADHPRRAVQFGPRKLWTSAAGAYQFMAVSPLPNGQKTRTNTWDRLQAKLGLPDFSPQSQDLAAIALIDEAGALQDVRAGRFADAVRKVAPIWASMPGAGYAQPERQLSALANAYAAAGGTFA